LTATRQLYPAADGVLQEHPTGIVECSNDEYHSGPGISKSHLDTIAEKSPLHYWHKYLNPERERKQPTEAMETGTAIHAAILEPDQFLSTYIQAPADAPKRPTPRQMEAKKPSGDTILAKEWWAEFDAKHEGKIILDADEYKACLAIRDRVHTHSQLAGLFQGGRAEVSVYAYLPVTIVDPETGEITEVEELVKCRYDYLHADGGLAVDLKSTTDASQAGSGKSSANFRYMLQPPWYFDVTHAAFGECPHTWAFVFVEKDPPYATGLYYPTPDDIERGRIAARRYFEKIITYRHLNRWPDYTGLNGAQPLILPGWAKL
jgi:PDDEXK-like domain of unknown function (DUF3799)